MASAFVLFGDQSCASGSLTGTDPACSQPTNHACAHGGWLCSFTLAANSLTAKCVHRRVIGGHRAGLGPPLISIPSYSGQAGGVGGRTHSESDALNSVPALCDIVRRGARGRPVRWGVRGNYCCRCYITLHKRSIL